MTYIVRRRDRFYIVAYGLGGPLTGRECDDASSVANDRDEAEVVAARIAEQHDAPPPAAGGPITSTPTSPRRGSADAPACPRHHRPAVRLVRRPLHQPRHRRLRLEVTTMTARRSVGSSGAGTPKYAVPNRDYGPRAVLSDPAGGE